MPDIQWLDFLLLKKKLLKTRFIINFPCVASQRGVRKAVPESLYGASDDALFYPPKFFRSHIESSLWLPYGAWS
jgi:hypothetical protein